MFARYLAVLVTLCGIATVGCDADTGEKFSALEHIEALGGSWTPEHPGPGNPVTVVSLGGTPTIDDDLRIFKQLTAVHTLNLDNTEVSDACIEHLKDLKVLRTLSIQKTYITDDGVQMLREDHPKLRVRR